MRPPAKVQECQNCRSKNVQDWRGGRFLCKKCLRRSERDDRGDDGSKDRRQQLVGAPTRESTPVPPPLSEWTYNLHPEPDNHPLGSLNMTIYPEPTLYLNFPPMQTTDIWGTLTSWADMEEEEGN